MDSEEVTPPQAGVIDPERSDADKKADESEVLVKITYGQKVFELEHLSLNQVFEKHVRLKEDMNGRRSDIIIGTSFHSMTISSVQEFGKIGIRTTGANLRMMKKVENETHAAVLLVHISCRFEYVANLTNLGIPLAQRRAEMNEHLNDQEKRSEIRHVVTLTMSFTMTTKYTPPGTVSLEKYYFGEAGGRGKYKRIAIAVQCPICNDVNRNNCKLMSHIIAHVFKTQKTWQCLYCLLKFDSDAQLQIHLKKCHPKETWSNELKTYACLICEIRFFAEFALAAHMQRVHYPLELPYLCGACDYRASSRRACFDHFLDKHGYDDSVMCPICLQVTPVYRNGRELSKNVAVFIEHMYKHKIKNDKCSSCELKFIHTGRLKEHELRDHCTVEGARPLCFEHHFVPKPKDRTRPAMNELSYTIAEAYEGLTVVLPDEGLLCRECTYTMDGANHFVGSLHCNNCSYVTSCYRSMLDHTNRICPSLEESLRDLPNPKRCLSFQEPVEANANIDKSAAATSAQHTNVAAPAKTATRRSKRLSGKY